MATRRRGDSCFLGSGQLTAGEILRVSVPPRLRVTPLPRARRRQLNIEIRRLGSGTALSEFVVFRRADLLVLLDQLVGVRPSRAGRLHGLLSRRGGRSRAQIHRRIGGRHFGDSLMHALQHNQHSLQPAFQTGRFHPNLLIGRTPTHHPYHTHGKAFGENTIVAGSIKRFAHLHFLFARHVVHLAGALALSLERAHHAIFLRDHAGGKLGIGNQHDFRSRRIGGDHFADDAIRRDHRHALLHPRAGATIHENHFRIGARAGGDHARGDGPRLRALLKGDQGFGAIGGRDLGFQELVLHLQAVELGLQAAVVRARIVHQNVVSEKARGPASDRLQHARQRRDGGYRPDAHHAHILVVAHLHRDQHQLRENHQQQYGDIAVAIEQRFHVRAIAGLG